MKKTRVLLSEDTRMSREGIAATVRGAHDMKVVASSAGDDDTLLQVHRLKPHVVLLDLGLRSQNDMHVLSALTKGFPDVKVIGMGLIPPQLGFIKFVEAGASGFILKDATKRDVLGTIRSVACGTKVLPPTLTSSLFSHVIERSLKRGKRTPANTVRMTRREGEIIALISEGLSNKEIAQRLNIAVYTVKSHVHNILEKQALHSRLQIAMLTRDEGAFRSNEILRLQNSRTPPHTGYSGGR